ncbi:MAG TPA: hypothetical protein VM261_33220 [Kofleriaceae bacterium]|nr:hypothetical protein [Kofleriaceae bacterium]
MAALTACTGASTDFLPAIDGGPDAPTDAPIDGEEQPGFFLVVDPTNITVTEGQVTSFNVSLSAEPTAPVTVTITPSDVARLQTPTEVTFDNDNWAAPTAVTLTALGDPDAAPNNLSVGLSAPGAMDNVTVTVAVVDDDLLEIFANPSAIEITEGLQGTVKVKLTAQPIEDVDVAVALSPALPGVASVSPTSLRFTAATWNVDQDVIITAEQDLDIAGATAMLTLTSAQVPDPTSVGTTIFDDDQVQIVPMPAALGTITEGGAATGLGISMTRDPGQNVRVTIVPELVGKVSVSPNFVDFDSTNWNLVQTVQVSGVQDDDTRDDTLDLVLSSPAVANSRRVSVTVDDNDTPTLVASATSVTVLEGNTVQVGVSLAFDPLGSVTVTAAIDNPTIATITAPSGGSLTFDSTDYDTPKMITIRGEQDQDLANDGTLVRFQATSLGASLDVPVTKTDDDTQVIETDMSTVTLDETGQATFGVRLRFRPNAGTTVNVSSGASPHASVAPTSIPFNLSDFNSFKPVTVTGTHDVDLVQDAVPIVLSGASAPASVTVDATVTDVDIQAIQVTPNNVTISEGLTGTFTVRLAYQPAGNVTVSIASMNGLVATAMPASIVFMPGNYNQPVTVTVTGAEDANAQIDTTSITASSAPIPAQNVAITVNDNDTQGLEATVSSMSLTEGTMASMTLGVRLRQDPLGNVTVNAESLDAAVVALTGTTSFVFNSGDYNQYKYVTVSALQDDDLATQTATVRFSSLSPALTTDVTVSKPDNDTQAINTSVSSVTLQENGTAQFGVRLAFQPPGNVIVQVASADSNKATTSGNLTFGPGDWNVFQNVTVTGTDDNNLAAETVNINLTSPGNAPARAVGATVNDDDTQAIQGVPSTINLTEGNQTTINVRLAYQPSTPSVTVTVGTSPSGVAGTSGNLTFSNTNWQTTQAVTITATQDTDLVDENTTLTLSGASATAVTCAVNVDDDDTLTIVSSPSSVTVNENTTGSFTVALSHQPLAAITVSVGLNPAGVATLSHSSIMFSTSNWSSPVTVTVTPVADVDNQSESTTVTLSSGATNNATVGITVNDTTVVDQPGWPTYFGQATATGSAMQRIAYKVTTAAAGSNWTLDDIRMITSAAGNMAKMAIYTHDSVNDAPSMLVATSAATSVVAGINTFTPTAAMLTPSTTYWIAFQVSGAISIGSTTGTSARRCTRATLSFGDSFPATWGMPSCINTNPINVFATLHQ